MTRHSPSSLTVLWRRETLEALATLTVVVAQLWILLDSYVGPLHYNVLAVRQYDSLERSARLSYGAAFAEYISFIRANSPDDAVVVLPSFQDDPVFGHTGFMQYFLFPRNLSNCPGEMTWTSCLAEVDGPRTYILAINAFPPQGGMGLEKVYLPFDEDRGLFAPNRTLEGVER